jgi:hypothetical protein
MPLKIAFTSCMDAERRPKQDVWRLIEAHDPHVLMLLGDQIYMDWGLSMGEVPDIKRQIEADKSGATLLGFAADMHRRYAAQWAIDDFRRMVCRFVQRRGADHLFVTWDEHDFAWNNAYGEGLDGPSDAVTGRVVPPKVKAMAMRVFRTFVEHLRAGRDEPYPPLDLGGPVPAQVAETPVPRLIDGVPFMLLDERSYRTHRGHPKPTLLGQQQWDHLKQAIEAPGGLLVVAGSSPLRYDYRFAQQGWSTDDGRSYPDYERLLKTVEGRRRPVLYLSGDVHRAQFGGELPAPSGAPSGVVEAIASAAAIGRLGLRKPAPTYGLVTIADSRDALTIDLFGDKGAGHHALRFDDHGWTTAPGAASAHADAATLADHEDVEAFAEPLTVISLRRPRSGEGPVDGAPSQLGGYHGEDLADAPSGLLLRRLDPGRIRIEPTSPAEALRAAFARAAESSRTLVFFIHGTGKSFHEAVQQAVTLRGRFPRCEPVMLTWPSDTGESFFSKLIGNLSHLSETDEVGEVLVPALDELFTMAREFHAVPLVLAARSLGADVLRHALRDGPAFPPPESLRHVLLSAPGTKRRRHADWFAKLPGVRWIVTFNADDHRLIGTMLGRSGPGDDQATRTLYIDFSNLPAVGDRHDYLVEDLGDDRLDALNDHLMHGGLDAAPTGVVRADSL